MRVIVYREVERMWGKHFQVSKTKQGKEMTEVVE